MQGIKSINTCEPITSNYKNTAVSFVKKGRKTNGTKEERNRQSTGRNDRLWTIHCHASTCTYESKCASSTGKQIGKTAVKRKKTRAWESSTAPTPANNSNSPHVNDRGELAVDEGEHDQRTDVAEEANAHITNKNIIEQINQKDANMTNE